tara:strand:- start:1623 stop:2825 length:1203 start_codon:yes stop_codon:yes gene_type:complete
MSDVNQTHLEKLEALPEGWADSSVSEIVQMVSANNKKLAQKKYLAEGDYPVIDQGQDFIGGYSNDKDLVIEEEPPFIVFGDHTRAFKFANFQFVPGADGVKIMKPLGVDPKWCFYIFQAIKLPNKGYSRHFQYLKEAYVPVPPPEQQKHIVAKIEELFSHIDSGIEALKKAKQLLKQYRQSVLKAAVTGELTKEWREVNNLSEESWQELAIGEISVVQTGKTPKRSTEEFWDNGTIPWLTSSSTNEAFTHQADQFVTQAAVDSGLKLFEPGTLLLAMYGEGKTRGQVTEITFQATCNQACAAIIVDEEKASRAYVRLRLYENYEETRKVASGGNQPNLNLSKVREISLPLPSLAEQAEIVSQVEKKFDAMSRLKSELEAQLLKAEKNKQSVLASAFLGKV